jgi:hypothetical protein
MKYNYNVQTGVTKVKIMSKRAKLLLVAGISSVGLAGAVAVPTFAAAGDHASACGSAHGAFASVNGNFGFLGQAGGTPGYHNGAVGQDAGATGSNNSQSTCND